MTDVNKIAETVVEVAKDVNGSNPVDTILADAELALDLAKKLRVILADAHPSLSKLIKALLF